MYEISVIDNTNANWPSCIKKFDKIWYSGDLGLLKRKIVTIVGSKNPSEKTKQTIKQIVKELGNDYVFISGISLGSDGICQFEATSNNYPSIAVLDSPINVFNPKEHEYLQNLVASKGLVISCLPLDGSVEKSNSINRNNLISQICSFCVIVEDCKNIGCINQAKSTSKLEKPVFVFSSQFVSSIPNAISVVSAYEIEEKLRNGILKPIQPDLF